jgi:hypothetical protein
MRRLPGADAGEGEPMIVTRRSVRDAEPVTYYDIPGDHQSWDENALLIASQYGLALDKAHQMLARTFPHVYEDRPQ